MNHIYQKQLQSLSQIKGRHTSLLSVLVPPQKHMTDLVSYLRHELTESVNIQDKMNRKDVLSSISRILE